MNQYEAPSIYEDTVLKQKLAARLLDLRENGFTLGYFYRLQAKAYVVLFLLFGLGIASWIALEFEPGVNLMVGVLFGVLLRDLGIARKQKKIWPFQAGWTDWDKVKQAAGQDPLGMS